MRANSVDELTGNDLEVIAMMDYGGEHASFFHHLLLSLVDLNDLLLMFLLLRMH